MKKSMIMIAAAGTLWGLLSLYFKYFSAHGLNAMQAVFVRNGTAALMMVIFLLVHDPQKVRLKRASHLLYFVGTGIVSLATSNVLYFICIDLAGASVAVLLLYTAPAFVMLFSVFLFSEILQMQKILALFFTLLGCAFISGVFTGNLSLSGFALLAGLGSGLGYALYSIFGTFALRDYDSVTITAYTVLFATIGVLPFSHPAELARAFVASPAMLAMAVTGGLLGTVVPYLLYTKGLAGVEAGKASILATVEPAVGVLVGFFVFHEKYAIHQYLGIAFILFSIVLVNIRLSVKS